MNNSLQSRSCAAWLVVLLAGLAAVGCSADPAKNPLHGGTCPKDRQYKGYCLPAADGGSAEPTGDAGKTDAGQDAGKTMGDAGTMGSIDAGPDAAMIDAGEPCPKNGSTRPCYTPDDDTYLQPPCRAGKQTCVAGLWGACANEVVPQDEKCDGADNDCDGHVDEAIFSKTCNTTLLGACKLGMTFCQAGAEKCVQTTMPVQETCNGTVAASDQDCDGVNDDADPDATRPCYDEPLGCTGNSTIGFKCTGACHAGTAHCVGGKLETVCADDKGPQPEAATLMTDPAAVDEDCDGTTDEGVNCSPGTYACYTGPTGTEGVGPCKAGTQTCSNNLLGSCMLQVTPKTETCDGIDNDCNHKIDDVATVGDQCTSDPAHPHGNCLDGAYQCMSNALQCVGPQFAASETACDGADEDCDGTADEDWNKQTDVNNCGTCNTKCGSGISCCAGGCVDIKSSNLNCGSCGHKCVAGDTCCSGGCVNTKKDAQNCGSCGKACALLNSCSNGGCVLL